MKKILVIDNEGSFTFNLVHLIEKILGYDVDVIISSNSDISIVNDYEYIFISPGPGIPEESLFCLDVIETYYKSKKILGVCLGLQAIVVAMGGKLRNLPNVFHGVSTPMSITTNKSILFQNVPNPFLAGRYHSWVADPINFPENLLVTCYDESGEVMALEHRDYNLYGVQFHPESIMTEVGEDIIKNFLHI